MDDTFDVDEILKGAEKDVLGAEELDEDAILGMEESFEKTTANHKEVKTEEPIVVSENGAQPSGSATSSVLVDNDDVEQLDYEEEVVPQKAAVHEEAKDAESADKPSTKPSFKTERVYDSRGAPPKNGGNKYYVNPKFNPQFGQAATNGAVPPLGFPPSELMPPGVAPAGPIRLPSVKIAPGMPLQMPNMPPAGFRPSMPLPGSIRLPGPIPLTLPPMVVPPPRNFNVPPPGLRMPNGMPPPGAAGPGGDAATWQLMVDAFVRKTTSDVPLGRSSRRRSRSPSSSDRSRSYSSSSYSSRSRSRSRSPRRHRRRSPKHRRSRSPHDRDQPLRRRPRSPPRREERRKEENASHHTIECAQAIGLDEEYLRKIEEQKRMREEVARRKEEARRGRRQDNNGSRYANDEHIRHRTDRDERDRVNDRRRVAAARDRDVPTHDHREPHRARYEANNISSNAEHQQRAATREQQRAAAEAAKQAAKAKPYLTVVVTNCGLSVARQLASTVGPTKKIWMINANAAAVIFDKHDDAKNFMLQYHAKSLNGVRIDVTLEKMFLNLAAIP